MNKKLIIFLSVIVAICGMFVFFSAVKASSSYSLETAAATSDYAWVSSSTESGLSFSTAFTLEGWIMLNGSTPGSNVTWGIIDKYGADVNRSYDFHLRNVSGTSRLRLIVDNAAGGEDILYVDWSPSTDTWYHVAVTWDGASKTAKFYVNGTQIGGDQVGSNVDTLRNGDADFLIGSYYDGIAYSSGNIFFDEVRVWSDVRTQTEIDDNKALQLCGNETNLEGYWKMENNGTDETSNGNDLSLANSAAYSAAQAATVTEGCGAGGSADSTPLLLEAISAIMNDE